MRKMTANTVVKLSLAVVATVILMGCSKKSSEEAPAPPPAPQAATGTKPTGAPVPAPSPVPADASLAGAVTPTSSVSDAVPTPPSPEPQETPEQKAEASRQIAMYEGVYRGSTDFSSRIDAIYRISDVGTAESVASLGRLFGFEKDPELKTEILDAFADVDGQDAQKVAILTAAVSPDQAKDVRQSAIDALTNIEAQKSLPILQNLTNDSDSDISESAKDAIEQVKANMEPSP